MGERLPTAGFDNGDISYIPAPVPVPDADTEIKIDPKSTRLELLEPFKPHWSDPNRPFEFEGLRCLLRIRGKCTTDEISAAGKWLKFKGHLTNIRLEPTPPPSNRHLGFRDLTISSLSLPSTQ